MAAPKKNGLRNIVLLDAALFIAGIYYWPVLVAALIVVALYSPTSALVFAVSLDIVFGPIPGSYNFFLHILAQYPLTISTAAIVLLLMAAKKSVTAGEWRIQVGQ